MTPKGKTETRLQVDNLTSVEWKACEVRLRCSLIQESLSTRDEMAHVEPINLNRYSSRLEKVM